MNSRLMRSFHMIVAIRSAASGIVLGVVKGISSIADGFKNFLVCVV